MPPFCRAGKMSSEPIATRNAKGRNAVKRLVVLRLDDFLAAIVAIRANVVAQMHFTRARLDGQRRCREGIVRTVHTALRRRLLILLNCHDYLLKIFRILTQPDPVSATGRMANAPASRSHATVQCFLSSGS